MSNNEPPPQATPSQPPKDTKELMPGVHVDLGYIKSIPGILTAAITFVSLVSFICVYAGRASTYWVNWHCIVEGSAALNFFGFVSMTAFITGLICYIIFVFSIYEKLTMVPWTLAVLIWSGVWAALYLIASAVTAAKGCGLSGVIAGAIFGFLAMLFLGARAFFAFMEFRAQRAPQAPPTQGPPPEYSQGTDFQQY